MSEIRLLVIDDDPGVLASVEFVASRSGYYVQTSSDVFGLALQLRKQKPDGILLDVDLPGLTGDKLAENLLKLRVAQGIKIVFHSAEPEDNLRALVERIGVEGYIPKGLDRREFVARLDAFFRVPGDSS